MLQVPSGQREKIKIYGTDYPTPDGTCIRDYIHINDLVSAHLLALEALDNKDKLVYNLGNGVGYSVREVIETARKVTGHPIPAEETPRRPGDSPAWWPHRRRSGKNWAGSRRSRPWRIL